MLNVGDLKITLLSPAEILDAKYIEEGSRKSQATSVPSSCYVDTSAKKMLPLSPENLFFRIDRLLGKRKNS